MSVLTRFAVLTALLFLSGCTPEEVGNPQVHSHDDNHRQSLKQIYRSSYQVNSEHGHVHTPHMGIVAPFRSGESQVGFVELKLHDDKGDLELWLTNDEAGTKPYDLSLNTAITVSFLNMEQKNVELRVRNSEENEDEQGKSTVRGNKTNYFIFPGETGSDASFLVGKGFVAEVAITFTAEGVTYTTNPFELKPHTH